MCSHLLGKPCQRIFRQRAFAGAQKCEQRQEGMGRLVMRPTPPAAGSSICGTEVDWNTVDPDSVFATVEDFANWRFLIFDGPAKNGNLVP